MKFRRCCCKGDCCTPNFSQTIIAPAAWYLSACFGTGSNARRYLGNLVVRVAGFPCEELNGDFVAMHNFFDGSFQTHCGWTYLTVYSGFGTPDNHRIGVSITEIQSSSPQTVRLSVSVEKTLYAGGPSGFASYSITVNTPDAIDIRTPLQVPSSQTNGTPGNVCFEGAVPDYVEVFAA